MNNFAWAIVASIVDSLISLVGIFGLMIKEELLNRLLILLIAFAAGGLIGGAFLHLLPEATELSQGRDVFIFVVLGFIAFFILEKYLYWRHCHEGVCTVHAFTYLNLIGNTVHNFTDGLVIGASFLVSIKFGIVTTLMIVFHEIPHEMGDFSVLVYGGFSKLKAVVYNFLSALVCILGTIAGFFLSKQMSGLTFYILTVTAGGFIYIAACDLVPELHKHSSSRGSLLSLLVFLLGILFIFLTKSLHLG